MTYEEIERWCEGLANDYTPYGPDRTMIIKDLKGRFLEVYKQGQIDAREGGELTPDELVVACRNIGVDLTCGFCASLFYTGGVDPGIKHGVKCSTLKDLDESFVSLMDRMIEVLHDVLDLDGTETGEVQDEAMNNAQDFYDMLTEIRSGETN